MADVLDRVKKLMELALHNPNDTEARTAAMAAVRLIDQHKIELRTKAAPPVPPVPPKRPRVDVDPYRDLQEMIRRAQQAAGWWERPPDHD